MTADDDDRDVNVVAAEWLAAGLAALTQQLAADPELSPATRERLVSEARPLMTGFYCGWLACAREIGEASLAGRPTTLDDVAALRAMPYGAWPGGRMAVEDDRTPTLREETIALRVKVAELQHALHHARAIAYQHCLCGWAE
jgi:hypothetical protein